MKLRPLVAALPALLLPGCGYWPQSDPVQVTVAGIESLPGEGLELRVLVKLRVENPNDRPIEYDGVYVRLDILGNPFASGVSGERGVVPRFGEAVVAVPVTVSALNVVRQVVGLIDGKPVDKFSYEASGKLNGGLFRTVQFHSAGEFTPPGSAPGSSAHARSADGEQQVAPATRERAGDVPR